MLKKYKAGDVVGELTLIEKISYTTPKGNSKNKWKCLCSCGKETIVFAANLNKTRSCGHLKSVMTSLAHFEDLTGCKYGRLTVVHRLPDRISKSNRHIVQYLCLCDCGSYTEVDAQELRKGSTVSCGCFSKENSVKRNCKIRIGDKYGKLTVVNKDQSFRYGRSTMSRWKCKCECGSEIVVFGNALKRGQVSCGCVNSKGEEEIAKILSDKHISFTRQYYFTDLLSEKGFPIFFDFAIFDDNQLKCVLEYQGIQHYIPQPNHFGDHQRNITDVLKRDYCAKHGIHLYEIRYDEDIFLALDAIFNLYDNTVPSSVQEKV